MFSNTPTIWPGYTGLTPTANRVALRGYAALRLVTNPVQNQIEWIMYGDVPGDGNEGRFAYSVTSMLNDSPPNVIRPQSVPVNVPGRFIRVQ